MAAKKRRSAKQILGQTARRYKKFGKLHELMLKAFPDRRTADFEVLDVAWFARKLKITGEAFYGYLRKDRLPYPRLKQILALPGCKKKAKDFEPFII